MRGSKGTSSMLNCLHRINYEKYTTSSCSSDAVDGYWLKLRRCGSSAYELAQRLASSSNAVSSIEK